MPTSDHRLVMLTFGLNVSDCEAFVTATHPTKRWNKRQETAAIGEAEGILAQETPMHEPIQKADAVLQTTATAVSLLGKHLKKPWNKQATRPWHRDFHATKKRLARELRDNATKRLNTMQHSALRKDGTFFHLTKNLLQPLKPTQKQPDPDLARALLADFSGNPPDDMPTITKLIKEYIPQVHMDDEPPTFAEFKRICQGKRRKAVGPDGVPHRLLGMLPDEHLHTLQASMLAVWKTRDIPAHWLRSEVVLMYNKGDPGRPENYRPIAITNSIYRVIM